MEHLLIYNCKFLCAKDWKIKEKKFLQKTEMEIKRTSDDWKTICFPSFG